MLYHYAYITLMELSQKTENTDLSDLDLEGLVIL